MIYNPADLKWPDGRPYDATERLAWEAGWEARAASSRDLLQDADAIKTKWEPVPVPDNIQMAKKEPFLTQRAILEDAVKEAVSEAWSMGFTDGCEYGKDHIHESTTSTDDIVARVLRNADAKGFGREGGA